MTARQQPASRYRGDLSRVPARIERGHHIRHGEPGADDEDRRIGSNRGERTRLRSIGNEPRIILERGREHGRDRGRRMRRCQHDDVGRVDAAGIRHDGPAASLARNTAIRLLTNNPRKQQALKEHKITVMERIPLVVTPNAHNERYIETKRDRLSHLGDGEQ